MKHRTDASTWVVFYAGIQELARLSADEATTEEIYEAGALVAYDYGCHPDEIEFRLVIDPFAAAFADGSGEGS